MRLLQSYLERHGRPLAFYTDKAALFANTPKSKDGAMPREGETPPTQIGRALQELGIEWIPAHSPQAKGRVERSFRHRPGPLGERAADRRRGYARTSQCLSRQRVPAGVGGAASRASR